MISVKNLDKLLTGFSPEHKIKVVYVDATSSARELERCHLCGPLAASVQASALLGVAVMSHELTLPDEVISLQMSVNGPIRGLMAEATVDGSLRGYTHVKVFDKYDGMADPDQMDVMGYEGEATIIRSIPGKVLASSKNIISPATIAAAVGEYYNNSLQRDVGIQFSTRTKRGYLESARCLMLELMPDGSEEAYEHINNFMEDGTVLRALQNGVAPRTICDLIGLRGVTFEAPKPLRFFCPCTPERVENMIKVLARQDLQELVAKGEACRVICHTCGKGYKISLARLKELLKGRV